MAAEARPPCRVALVAAVADPPLGAESEQRLDCLASPFLRREVDRRDAAALALI